MPVMPSEEYPTDTGHLDRETPYVVETGRATEEVTARHCKEQ